MKRKNLRRIYTLTAAPDGPTGREMEELAKEVVFAARQNADDIMHNYTKQNPRMLFAIDHVRRGREIRIGIRNEGPISVYLHDKALHRVNARSVEQWPGVGWLQAAIDEVMLLRGPRGVGVVKGIPR